MAVREIDWRWRVNWEIFYVVGLFYWIFFNFYLEIYRQWIDKVYSSMLGIFFMFEVTTPGLSKIENFISLILSWIAYKSG